MKIIKYRWLILAFWIAAFLFFVMNQPNLNSIIGKKGDNLLENSAASKQASELLQKMNLEDENSLVVVFYNEHGLSNTDLSMIQSQVKNLKDNSDLKITDTLDPFTTPDAKDRLISADGTTLIAQISFDITDRTSSEILNAFGSALNPCSIEHYITGDIAIGSDYTQSVSIGVDKSAIITIAFIFIILIIMFRSVVTPFVSLFAVGISYICSMGIIGFLITYYNFPVTSFTEMFLILVLFGIGTDYHILLLNRFKEEMAHGQTVDQAIATSLKTAGKTIFYSGMTVFIGFLSLSFVQFPVYRSANAVAIGIIVLLLEILTLTPVIMKLLASKIFWPSHAKAGHKDSRFWANLTSLSVKKPILSLLLVAIIITPVILFNTTRLSFDSMADLDSNLPSIKGFHLIADKFGSGTAMPATLVIKNDKAMDNNEALTAIDNLTQEIADIDGIDTVYGPTRPKGSQIAQLYTSDQLETVTNGLNSANNGIQSVSDGIGQINSALAIPDFSQVNTLAEGSSDVASGVNALTDGLAAVDYGIQQGAQGAATLKTGIAGLKLGIISIHDGLTQITEQLTLVQNGYLTLGESYHNIGNSLSQLNQLEASMEYHVNNLDEKLPNNADVAALKQMLALLSQSLSQLSDGMTLANVNYDTLTQGLVKLNAAVTTVSESMGEQSELMNGITQLENGAEALSTGLSQGEAGQRLFIENMNQLSSGSSQVHDGIDTLNANLSDMGNQVKTLKEALNQGKDGLDQIQDGMSEGTDYLTKLTETKTFYIPADEMKSDDIQQMLNAYMSDDRTAAKLTITLKSEPYSEEALSLISQIQQKAKESVGATVISNAQIGIAGATASSDDMKNMATSDILFTQVMVISAIFILLIIVTRSVMIPAYIVGSLVAAYYTALSATAFISQHLFHNPDGMAWNVPFFAFIMISTLGVDYSIFLMERFREYKSIEAKEAIVKAAKNIGGVVISAAIILAGTFATLYPSNLVVLMELAICVIIGLLLLCMVFLPIVIPALISIQDKIKNIRK